MDISAATPTTHYYLTSTTQFGESHEIQVGNPDSPFRTTYRLYRADSRPERIWSRISHGCFFCALNVSAAQARLIGDAWVKAAEDAESPERQGIDDDYLTSAGNSWVNDHLLIEGSTGILSTQYRIYRHRTDATTVWNVINSDGFDCTLNVSPEQARQIGGAWLKAAEDAEEAQRQREWEEDIEVQRESNRLLEDQLCAEAEARGEEYVPAAIGVEHMHFIELAMLHGEPLRPWQEALKPQSLYMEYTHGGRIDLVCSPQGMHSAWHRWLSPDQSRYRVYVEHSPTATEASYSAVADDFGVLTIVPRECHA